MRIIAFAALFASPLFAGALPHLPKSLPLPKAEPRYKVHKVDILGEDDREEVTEFYSEYPWKVGRLLITFHNSGAVSSCTGSIIGEEYILTSAHCLINEDTGDLAKNILFDPGAHGGKTDNESREVANEYWILSEELTRFSRQKQEGRARKLEDSKTDLALIRFPRRSGKKAIGVRQGVLNFSALPESFYFPSYVYTLGYPGDKKENTLWEQVCEVDRVRSQVFPTTCDAIKGQSGSPVFEFGSFKERGSPIIGVLSATTSQMTAVTPLSKDLISDLKTIMNNPTKAVSSFTKFIAEKPTHGFSIENGCAKDILTSVAYRRNGELFTEGWFVIEPGKRYELFRTDESSVFFMAKTRDGKHRWDGKHSIYISDKVNDYVPTRLLDLGPTYRNHAFHLTCD